MLTLFASQKYEQQKFSGVFITNIQHNHKAKG